MIFDSRIFYTPTYCWFESVGVFSVARIVQMQLNAFWLPLNTRLKEIWEPLQEGRKRSLIPIGKSAWYTGSYV